MKKKLFFILLFVLTMGMAGCEFLGEDVEEFTEAYCRENPDSSICQGDIIDDLQDESIENLFWSIEQDSKKDIQDFCETYFSITNIDLLDKCREDQASLIPDDLEGYEIETIEYDEEYIVIIKKDDQSDVYKFTFKLITVEGDTFVEEWTYEVIDYDDPGPDPMGITLEKATELANEFAEKYVNPEIDNEVFCTEYYPDMVQLCMSNRIWSLGAGITLTHKELKLENGAYSFTVQVGYSEYYIPGEKEFEVEFPLDGDEYKIKVITIWTNTEEIYYDHWEDYETLILELLDEQIPDNYCRAHFSDDTVDDCILFHQKMTSHGIVLDIVAFQETAVGFDVEYQLTFPDGVWERTIVPVSMSDVDVAVDIAQPFPYLTPLTMPQMVNLILERFDNATSEVDVCYNSSADYLAQCRLLELQFQSGLQWELINQEDDTESDITHITIEESDADGNTSSKDVEIEFEQDDDGWNFNVNFSFRFYRPHMQKVYRFLFPMAIELGNWDHDEEAYCEIYGAYFDNCRVLKSRMVADQLTVQFVIHEIDDLATPYQFKIDLYDHGLTLIDSIIFEFNFSYDDEDMLLIDGGQVLDHLDPPHDEYLDIINAYLEAYLDETKTDQDIYDQFNSGMIMMGMYRRDYIVTQGLDYDVIDVTWAALGYNYEYTATVLFTREGFSKEVELKYELFPRGDGTHNLFIVEFLALITEVEFNNFIAKLLLDFVSPDLATDDFCEFYLLDAEYIKCLDLRHQVMRDGYIVSLNAINPGDFTIFFDLDFTHPDGQVTTLSFAGAQFRDILHNPHLELSVNYSDPDLLEELSIYLDDGLTYGFNTHGINLTTFCDEFAVCTPETFDDINEQIHQVDYFASWDFFDLENPKLSVILRFEFMDGDIEYHQYHATYTMHPDGYKLWVLVYEGKYYMLPFDAISLDEMNVQSIFDDFIDDFNDPLVSNEMLGVSYFGNATVFSTSSFMRYRDLLLEDGGTITATDLVFSHDDGLGSLIFTTTVTIDFVGYDDYVLDYNVAIFANVDGYYIVFTY